MPPEKPNVFMTVYNRPLEPQKSSPNPETLLLLRPTLMFFLSLCRSSKCPPVQYLTKISYTSLISHKCLMSMSISSTFITVNLTFIAEYKSWSSSLYLHLHPSITSSLLGLNILCSNILNTHSLCSFFSVKSNPTFFWCWYIEFQLIWCYYSKEHKLVHHMYQLLSIQKSYYDNVMSLSM